MIDITVRGSGDKKTAVAIGFFDGLHLGHIEVIKKTLERQGLSSVVFTFSDKTLLPKFTVGENIINYQLKQELLAKVGIDYIFAPDFDLVKNLSPEDFVDDILIKHLNASFVTCGYDFHFAKGGKSNSEKLKEICEKRGIEIEIVPPVRLDGEIVSSTAIRAMIKSGELEKANALLGYELTYVLPVIHGNKIGRTMGFPTINQIIPHGNIVPKNGVYKSWVQLDGINYASITNIGVKPTIKLQAGEIVREPVMETHIIGFDADLYGLRVRVVLRSYMRPEREFSGLDELRQQLEADKREALKK